MGSSIDIGISDQQRQQISEGLSRVLADTYVLYGKTHGFHWNVTGPMFNTLHLMFIAVHRAVECSRRDRRTDSRAW